jgi:hypothetical protein
MNAWVERSQEKGKGKGKDQEVIEEDSIGRERSERKGKGEDKQRRDQSAPNGVPRSLIQGEKCLGDPDVGEGLPGEGEMTLYVLADDGLLVVAGHVVPLDPVPVEVV